MGPCMEGRERSSLVSSCKGTTPIMGPTLITSSKLNSLPKVPSKYCYTEGYGFNIGISRGHNSVYSILSPNPCPSHMQDTFIPCHLPSGLNSFQHRLATLTSEAPSQSDAGYT